MLFVVYINSFMCALLVSTIKNHAHVNRVCFICSLIFHSHFNGLLGIIRFWPRLFVRLRKKTDTQYQSSAAAAIGARKEREREKLVQPEQPTENEPSASASASARNILCA